MLRVGYTPLSSTRSPAIIDLDMVAGRSLFLLLVIAVLLTRTGEALATSTYCAVVTDTPDGSLNMRVGPGAAYSAVARLAPSDFVFVDTGSCRAGLCDETRRWQFVEGVPRLDNDTDPLTQGWVHSKFIKEVDCPNYLKNIGQKGAASSVSDPMPVMVFTEKGIYLSAAPEQRADIGEQLALKDLGRRFRSCRVTAEYYQGDEEGVSTSISCDNVIVTVSTSENGVITGFWTTSPRAAFSNGVQVGSPVALAVGKIAYCNLAREDEGEYCKESEESRIRYDIYRDDNCSLAKVGDRSNVYFGAFRISDCVVVAGLGHDSGNE